MIKMKNKIDFKNYTSLFVALAAVIIAVPLRIAQYYKIIDASTGFYNETDITVYALYAISVICIAVSLVVPFLKHKSLKPAPLSVKSTEFMIVSLIMAITLIIDSASQLMSFFNLFSDSAMVNVDIKSYISAQGGTLLLMQAIFGAVSALYFFVSGVTIGLGNADSSKYKILALVPVAWCIFRLLYRFKRTISFVNVSDLLFELFLIVFTMMFFFALAQVNSKIDVNGDGQNMLQSVYWKIFGYGIPAAFFAIVCFLPRFILLITGSADHINTHYPVSYCDLGFAVFAIYTCISGIKANTKSNEE